jgi:hypothetical protein
MLEPILKIAPTMGIPDSSLAGVRDAVSRGDIAAVSRTFLDARRAVSERQFVPAVELAGWCALIGDRDAAFAYLERAYEAHAPAMMYIRNLGMVPESLKSDPRWDALVARLHFPPSPAESGS